jgi:hypothetical protein
MAASFANHGGCVSMVRMKIERFWIACFLIGSCTLSGGQIKRTSVPLGNAIDVALTKGSLTYGDARPFHVRVSVTEPENPQSPYQGTFEEWWVSSTQWRREVTDKDGLRQTIVMAGGSKTERDEGDYFPLWLRNFQSAILDPIPNLNQWKATGASIEQMTLPDGRKSDACARAQSKIGMGDRATDAFSNVCFDGDGRLKFVGSPRCGMEFHDYKAFGQKQIARKYVEDPEPGTTLVGQVVLLEDDSRFSLSSGLFTPLPTNDDRFQTAVVNSQQIEKLIEDNPPIAWPAVRSGNVHGHLAMYISADAQGQVREAWPLNSDNAGLEDPAREQVRTWKLKPAVDATGKRVQVDGGLGFIFDTKIGDPLPVISGAQIGAQSTGCGYEPILPAGLLPSGTKFKITAGVNEAGKLTGESYPPGIAWDVIQKARLNTMACKFKPYIVNGKPTYYAVEFWFTAP